MDKGYVIMDQPCRIFAHTILGSWEWDVSKIYHGSLDPSEDLQGSATEIAESADVTILYYCRYLLSVVN